MKFFVEITETLQRTVEVEAETVEGSERLVREAYRGGEVVLSSEDCVAAEFAVLQGGQQ